MILPEIVPLGENSLIVRLSHSLDVKINADACALAAAIESAGLEGVVDVVPANSSVGIYMDQSSQTQAVRAAVARILENGSTTKTENHGRAHAIPVVYDGPDLLDVAARIGLPVSTVIEIHASREYQVFAVGFAPGFGYLGELDERIAVPRRSEPRTNIAAGSVAIANRQTAIYPLDTPGGWNIIGMTKTRVFDIDRDPASLFAVGDRVRFLPA